MAGDCQALNLEAIEGAATPPLGAPPSARRPVWVERLHARVDHALNQNHRKERLIVGMALALFVVGLLLVLLAYRLRNPYVVGAALILQTFLIFPFKAIEKLRRDNLLLRIFPDLIEGLPKDAAVKEIKMLLAFLRGGK